MMFFFLTIIGCSSVIDLTITNTVASITSPNYPNLYPSNAECYYYIRAPESYRVVLQFTDFNIPTNDRNNCYDTVEIRYYHLGMGIDFVFFLLMFFFFL
jgi:hypothetical protein